MVAPASCTVTEARLVLAVAGSHAFDVCSPLRASLIGLAVALLLTGCAGTADGHAGPVAWTDPLVVDRGARTVTLQADLAEIDGGCGDLTAAPSVHEQPSRVAIGLALTIHPSAPGTICAASRLAFLRVQVHLKAPLGTRVLVDSTTRRGHTPLVLSQTPAVHDLPAAFTERRPSWNERTGEVYRWWRNTDNVQINLFIATPPVLARQLTGLAAEDAVPVTVHGHPAELWRKQAGDTVMTAVRWREASGTDLLLQVIDQSSRPQTSADIVQIADSTR